MTIITKDILTNNENIRRIFRGNVAYYSIVDVFACITNSKLPKACWKNLKGKNYELQSEVVKLKLLAKDNKYRFTDCASEDIIEFIIDHIPTKLLKI